MMVEYFIDEIMSEGGEIMRRTCFFAALQSLVAACNTACRNSVIGWQFL